MPKQEIKLVFKKEILPQNFVLIFESKSDLSQNFTPGKFMSIEVDEKKYRTYSILSLSKNPNKIFSETSLPNLKEGSYVGFLIKAVEGGSTAQFIDELKIGSYSTSIGPSGSFKLKTYKNPKNFVATGTGLAPFVAMIKDNLNQIPETKINLYFGSKSIKEDLTKFFFEEYLTPDYPNFKIYNSLSDEKEIIESQKILKGRVTETVLKKEEAKTDFKDREFYLCGNPNMVTDMEKILKNSGIKEEKIIKEKY